MMELTPGDLKDYLFNQLSEPQRMELAMDLWDSISPDQQSAKISDSELAELRRRIAAADSGEMQFHPWQEVKQRLLNRHG